jgi:16S rRNA (cytidine1402-2'-O)-methyltransferase
VHEEFIRGNAAEVLQRVQEHELKGEMTLLIGKHERAAMPAAGRGIASRVEEIMREGSVDENTALKVVAKELGVSKSEAYRELQRVKRKK